MTIDETIKDLKGEYSSPYNNQLAEWLEELKELRESNRTLLLGEGHFITEDNLDKSIDSAYFKGYNKAIDDFTEHIRAYYVSRQELGYVATTYEDLLNLLSKTAEQLKGAKAD